MERKNSLSVIKADVGGFVGHSAMHDDLIETAKNRLSDEKKREQLLIFM